MDSTPWLVIDDEYTSCSFDTERLRRFEQGPLHDSTEVDAALSLLDAIGEFVEGWEDGTSDESRLMTENALRVLQTACARMGIEVDVTSNLDTSGSRRREYVVWEMLESAHAQLLDFDRIQLVNTLEETGWPTVDRECDELRRLWKSACKPAQFSAVGNQALRVIEAASDLLGDFAVPRIQSINRLTGVLDAASPSGKANDHLRSLIRDAVNLANAAKHDSEPSRVKAGAAANAALCVVGIMRAASGA